MDKQQFIWCFVIIFLSLLSYTDIKEKKLSVVTILVFALIAICFLFLQKSSLFLFCCNLLPGMICLLSSFFTKESIGYGDGFTILVLGSLLGGMVCLFMCGIAFLFSGVYAAVLVLANKRKSKNYRKKNRKEESTEGFLKTKIAFIPFLLASAEVILLYA